MNKYKLIAFAIILIASCSPKYKSFYEYFPIQSSNGKVCANQCLLLKETCYQSARQELQMCENRAEYAFQSCESRKIYGRNKDGDVKCSANCFCSKDSCRINTNSCDFNHRQCYVNCGGKIREINRCISNCEDARPASIRMYGLSSKPSNKTTLKSFQKK